MNPFSAAPPRVRAVAYWVVFLGGIGLGATQVAYGDVQPHWLDVASRVFLFVAGGFGITAASNTKVRAGRALQASDPQVQVAATAVADKVVEQLRDSKGRFLPAKR